MILLAEKSAECGIRLSPVELVCFERYLLELWEWSKRFNLTGLRSQERIVIELFLDSLMPAAFLPLEGSLLDVGSGAGFPGLPLKILYPRLKTVLLESNSKKVSFLKHVIRSLRLQDTKVIHGRIEAYRGWFSGQGFGVVTARAVADFRQSILWCSPLLERGGLLVTFLGAEGEKIVAENEKTITELGLRMERHLSYSLPGRKSQRYFSILRMQET